MAATTLPPGPKGHFITGNLPEFRRDPLGFLTSVAREFGDAVPLRLGSQKVLLLNHPDYVEHVLVANSRNFAKGRGLQRARLLLGNGLLTNEGESWLRQRRLMQPAFHRERIAGYGQVMADLTERMLGEWRDGEARDIHAEMMPFSNVSLSGWE